MGNLGPGVTSPWCKISSDEQYCKSNIFFQIPPANRTGYEYPGQRDAEDFSCYSCTFFWPRIIHSQLMLRTVVGLALFFTSSFSDLKNRCEVSRSQFLAKPPKCTCVIRIHLRSDPAGNSNVTPINDCQLCSRGDSHCIISTQR